MPKRFLLTLLIIFSLLGIKPLAATVKLKERVCRLEEKIVLSDFPKKLQDVRIWVPYPVSDNWQKISEFKISGPFKRRIFFDKKFKNKILFLTFPKNIRHKDPLEITLSFKVQRREYAGSPDNAVSKETLSHFLKADRLVPVNGEIKKLAEKVTQGKSGDLEKVRAIYDYLIAELTYARDDPKICGIGDSLLTLQHKKGICTDYHSLFISLVRSLGIPAKFEIGFRIPADTQEGKLNGYHCWAKFYLKSKGWVPVDISEADKHPEKKDYFFGHIDENRVHLTSGRDIVFAYAQDSPPLNFFIYPYAEVNGQEFHDIQTNIFFRQEQKES